MAARGNHPPTNAKIDLSRLHRARQLFASKGSTDILVTSLEGLGVELDNRAKAIEKIQSISPTTGKYVTRAGKLSTAISYASHRLTEVMIRH